MCIQSGSITWFLFFQGTCLCFISLRPLNLLQQHYYLLFTIKSHKATAGNHHDEAESGHQYNWCGLLIPRFRCKQNSGSQRLVHKLPAVIQCVIFMRHRVFCQMHHTYCNGKNYFKVYFGSMAAFLQEVLRLKTWKAHNVLHTHANQSVILFVDILSSSSSSVCNAANYKIP